MSTYKEKTVFYFWKATQIVHSEHNGISPLNLEIITSKFVHKPNSMFCQNGDDLIFYIEYDRAWCFLALEC